MQHETVIVLDFGGQYNQLIARRIIQIIQYSSFAYVILLWKSLHRCVIIL